MGVRVLVRIAVAALAVLLVAVAVIFAVSLCRHIPSPLRGKETGSSDHRFAYAAAFVLVALGLVTGSFATRTCRRAL